METLVGKVALVTGASRGVGKGIALGLGEQGATVYVTGRTEIGGALPGTVQETAEEVTAVGGRGVAIACDHRDDEQTRQAVRRIVADAGHLDVLVNNVWGGYEYFWDGTPFWEEAGFWTQPIERWDSAFQAGVRAHYVTYGAAKAATDHMVACMAHELREHGVTAVSLYPGFVRTESVLRAAEYIDLTDSESPQFVGRGVAALATDPDVIRHTGQVVRTAHLAHHYNFTDPNPRWCSTGADRWARTPSGGPEHDVTCPS
ncbi:SDR family NAD(P)-dependent oxidoreductase [Kribbella capetownensis]|uniref:SDR family NAD(P)-dependent oxidoreductase n=1 Tax=Kribbella capetownensis TaxID=1572659 RepID=A0A4R0K7G3_9ACTN|nr:SDR family NAD(P)-dependent oxidoreductase [Kribbella capetownensis]TCC53996.1 SDR family NAD(P)-dependent oxidoreductase [Kribbella capetownensis]